MASGGWGLEESGRNPQEGLTNFSASSKTVATYIGAVM